MSTRHQKPDRTSDNQHRSRNEPKDSTMHSHDPSRADSLPFRMSSKNTYNSDANVDFVDYGGTGHKTLSSSETGQEHMDDASQLLSMQSNTKQRGSSDPSGRSRLSESNNRGHTADNSLYFGLSPTFFKHQPMDNGGADSQTLDYESYRGASTTNMQPDAMSSSTTAMHAAPLDAPSTFTSDSMNKEQTIPSLAGKDLSEPAAANIHDTLSKSSSENGNNWEKSLHEQSPRIDLEQEMNSESTHANVLPSTTLERGFDSSRDHHGTQSLHDPTTNIGQVPHHDRFISSMDNLEDVTDTKGDRVNSTNSDRHGSQHSSLLTDTAAGTGIMGLGAAAAATGHSPASMTHHDSSATGTQGHMSQGAFSTSPSRMSTSGQDSESSMHVPSTPIEHASDQGHNDTQIKTIHEPYHRAGEVGSVGTNTAPPTAPASVGTSGPALKKRTTWYGFEVPVKERSSKDPKRLSLGFGFGYKEHVSSFKSAKGTSASASSPTVASPSSSSSTPVVDSMQPQRSSTGKEPIAHPFSPSQDRPVHVAESYNTSNKPKGHYLTRSKSKKPSAPKVMPQYVPPNMRRSHVPPPPSPSVTKAPISTAPIAAGGGVASARLLPSTTASAQPQYLSATALGKRPIARSFSPSQDRPVHVVESYHTSDMPKGHYLTHPSPFKSKEPSVSKTAPTATATTAGGAASAMSTSSATGSGQPQHPSITALGKKPIARSFSPSQDRPVHVVESYHTSDMPKGHYLTHPSPSKTKEPSVLKTAPTATATTAGGAASAMSTSSATGSGQPQHPSITAIGKKPIARSFSPSQDRPVHVVESYHTSDMPKGHYLTHPSPFKTRKSVSHKAIPNFIPANNMRRSHVSSAVPAASVATTQAPTTSSTAIAAQPAGNSTLHNLAGGAAMGAPVALAVHNIDHMDHKNDNDSLPQSSDPAGSSSDHAVALKQQKDDPTLYPEEQGSYPREDQGQRNNIKDSPPHSLPLTSPSSGSMAVPIAAGTTAAALESAADVPTNHAPQPSTLQREHHLTAATLKKPVSDLSLYEEEEGAYPRGGDEGGLHENPSPAVHPIGATEEVQLDADKMNAHHDAHQSMTDKVMGTLHGLHMPAILGGGDGKDKGKEERMKKVHDHNEAADVATATAVVGVGAGIGAFAAGTTGMNKGVGAGIGALAAGAIAMNKSLVGRKTSSSIKASSAEEKMLPGPSSMDKPVTDSKAPSTVMASSSETSTSPSTSPSTAPLAGGIAEAADTPTMDRSAMGSMTSPTVKAPSTMLDARGGAAGPDAMNIIMVDSQAPLPAKSSSTKTSELPIASKMLGAGAGAADIAAELRARTPKPYETHGIHADMPAMDEDQPTLISARKVEPVAVIPPVDSVLVTDKATMTRSAGSAIPYTSATKTPDTHATAFGAMNGKYDASAGTSSYSASSSSSSTAAPLAAATAVIAAGAAHAATKRDDHGHKELDVQDNKTTEHSAPAIATESTDTGDAVKPTRTHVNKVAETAAAAIPTADYAAYVHKPHDEAEYDPDMYASTMDGPAAHKRDDHGHIVLEEYDHNRVDPTTTTHAAAPVIADDTTSEVSGLDHEMVDNEAPATATTSTTAGPVVKPTETDFGKAATIVAVTAIPVSAYATRAHEGKEKAEYDSDEQKETRAEQEDRIFVDKAPDAIATASPHKTDEDIVEMRTTTATMIMPEDEIEMFPESVGSTSKVPPAALIIDTIEETSWSSGDDVQMDPLTTVMVVEAAGSEGDEEVAAEGIMETKETDKETDETDIETVKKEKKPRVPIKTRISKVTAPAAAAITSAAVAYKERQPAMKKRPSLRIKEDDVHKPTVPIVSHQLTMTEDDVDEPVVPIVSHRLTLTEDDVDKPVPRLSAFPVLRLTEDDVDKPDPSTARYPVIPKVEPKLVSTSALKVANASRPMIPDQPVQGKDIKLPTMHMPKVPKVHMPEMNMPKVSKPKLPKMSKPKLPKITKPKLPKVHMPTITKRKSKVTPEPAPVSSVATTTTETTSATPVDAVAPAVAPLPIFAAGDKTEIADTAVAKDEPAMAPVAPMTEVAETTMPVAAPTPVVQEPVKPRMVEGPVKKPVIVAATAVPVAAAAATTHPSPPPTLPALPPSPPPVAQTPIPAPAPSPPAPAPSKTPTILSNVAAPPAGYTGSIPKVGEGESLIWVKKIYTTQQYFDPEDELDELGYRKDRDVSRYIMGAGGNRRSGNYSDTKNRGGPYTGGGKRVDYHPSNHTRPERYVDSPAPPQSANEYRQTTARK